MRSTNLQLAARTTVAAACVATVTACGGGDEAQIPLLSASTCTSMPAAFTMAGVRLTSAAVVPATAATATQVAIPEHCELGGAVDERTGTDGQPYAIKFRLRVPLEDRWSGRFLFTGGGGSNGVVGTALTAPGALTSPLARGYAVVAQDSGHDNAVNNIPTRSGTRSFSFDYQARVDNGYRSYDRITQVSKELIRSLYGIYPRRSYFAGCSEGGREAVMVTQRFPDQFDGVIAGDPLLAAPMASLVRPAFIEQTYAELARKQGIFDRNGLPFLNQALTDSDLTVLANAIAQTCDAMDGVVDGMSQDFKGCSAAFNPAKLTCAPGQTSGCLSADKVAAIQTQMGGIPGDFSWAYDMGAVPGQFRSWWLGPFTAVQSSSIMISGAFPTTYLTPPPVIDLTINNGAEPYRAMLNFDITRDIGGIRATTPQYPQSIWDIMFATATDLSRFRDHGGKMILYHGASDGAFTINQTIDWWRQVDVANSGNASSFSRLYPVPGMGHCAGGPATSSFEMLDALEQWVEQGVAPASIVATAPAGTPWPGRTRPLCAYPLVARYKGGDVESAASFTCASP